MAFDWEGILGAEGSSLQSAYDDALDYFDRIEHGYSRPKTYASDYRAPEFCDDDGLPECNGNYPYCEHDCKSCEYSRWCDQNYDKCDYHCLTCPYESPDPVWEDCSCGVRLPLTPEQEREAEEFDGDSTWHCPDSRQSDSAVPPAADSCCEECASPAEMEKSEKPTKPSWHGSFDDDFLLLED